MSDERTTQELERRLSEAIAAVWQRRRCQVIGRVDVLIRAAALLREGNSPEEAAGVVADAKEEAHRLAGSLGSFGFGEGSDIAAEIEELLSWPDSGQEGCAPRTAEPGWTGWINRLELQVTALKAYVEAR